MPHAYGARCVIARDARLGPESPVGICRRNLGRVATHSEFAVPPAYPLRRPRQVAIAATVALIAAACTSGGTTRSDDRAGPAATPTVNATQGSGADPSTVANLDVLPVRAGPRRETTGDVPHVQIDAPRVRELDVGLRNRAFALPGVDNLESVRSLPGARGLAVSDDTTLVRPDVIAGTREFAHFHPDGSLHVWLPVDRAIEVDEKKWGELHPWVGRDGFWDGVVMLYTPESADELDVLMRVILDAYNFVTGADVDPLDLDQSSRRPDDN